MRAPFVKGQIVVWVDPGWPQWIGHKAVVVSTDEGNAFVQWLTGPRMGRASEGWLFKRFRLLPDQRRMV